MAKYKLSNKRESPDHKVSQYLITVTFDNPVEDEPELVFEQEVLLPDTGTEKAAQEYADDYEKSYSLVK